MPRDVPKFRVDFDEPADTRYNEIWNHFKDGIISMEDYFYESIPPEGRDFFVNNEKEFARAQPDVYAAMVALAEITGLSRYQTLAVNSITEFSTYCTSIVARTPTGEITHVRNLDFAATEMMKELVYEAILVKDGREMATSPLIAGYIGSYTGHKPGSWSVSYNVRETTVVPDPKVIKANL